MAPWASHMYEHDDTSRSSEHPQRTRHDSRLNPPAYPYDPYDSSHPSTSPIARSRSRGHVRRSSHHERASKRRWPPRPSVEDEDESLAREHMSPAPTDGQGVVSCGIIDQDPILIEVPDYIPDRRFVWMPSAKSEAPSQPPPAQTSGINTPPNSDDEKMRRGRRKVPKLETEMLPEMRRAPSPYSWTKPVPDSRPVSSGDLFLSPDVLTPKASGTPSRRTASQAPDDMRSRDVDKSAGRRTSAGARVSYGQAEDKWDETTPGRDAARYSYTKRTSADSSPHTSGVFSSPVAEERIKANYTTAGASVERPPSPSRRLSYEDPRRPAPLKTSSSYASAQTPPRSRHGEARNSQASLDASPRSLSSRYPPSPPRSPRLNTDRLRETSQSGTSSSRPPSRGGPVQSSPQPSPHMSNPSPSFDYSGSTLLAGAALASSLPYRPSQPSRLASATLPGSLRRNGARDSLPYPDDDRRHESMPSERDHQYLPSDPHGSLQPGLQATRSRSSNPAAASSGCEPSQRPPMPFRHSAADAIPTSPASPRTPRPASSGKAEASRASTGGQAVVALPPCSRAEYTSRYQDWYTLEDCPGFDICPDCLEQVFGKTAFRSQFRKSPRNNREAVRLEVKCDFSDAWIRLAWLLINARGLSTLNLLRSVANVDLEEEPCPGAAAAVRTWYSVRDRDGHFLRGFAVCKKDARKLQILLPGYRDLLVPLTMRASYPYDEYGGLSRVCAFRATLNNRFPLYLDMLVAKHEEAVSARRLPDPWSFVSFVRHKTSVPECPRDDMARGQKWHFIASVLPALTVCEDCYDELVKPHADRDSDVAMRFNSTPQTVHGEGRLGLSCQLYSRRMRRVLARAVENNDLRYLARKASERKDAEDRLQERIAELRRAADRIRDEEAAYGVYEISGRAQYELERLEDEMASVAQQWAQWE